MERNRPNTLSQGIPEVPGRAGRLDVASRRAALESLRSTTLRAPSAGPILITGESGAGKTRLWGRLADEAPSNWRFAVVQAAPALDAVDFLGLAAAQLGVEPSNRLAINRLAIASALQDESTDGRSWVLVVENLHQASPEIWTEIEALAAGGGEGPRREFAAILLVGRTELARRLSARPFQTLANRLAGHIHLPPLDIDETTELLASVHADRLDADRVEHLHRDAAGNPRALLRLAEIRGLGRRPPSAASRLAAPAPTTAPAPRQEPTAASSQRREAVPAIAAARVAAPPLVPSKPPLREEEGLIEVGWSGSMEAENEQASDSDEQQEPRRTNVATAPLGEEAIEDRYAALQAWTEWARNRDRMNPNPRPIVESAEEGDPEASRDEEPESDQPGDEAGADLGADVRAEVEHDHAPYSQLFTRLGQPK